MSDIERMVGRAIQQQLAKAEPRKLSTSYVSTVTLLTGEVVEIRRIDETNELVGLDGAYLEATDASDCPHSPYDTSAVLIVPDDEPRKTLVEIQQLPGDGTCTKTSSSTG